MNNFILGLILLSILNVSNVFSDTSNIFEDHTLQIYSPIKAGVKDIEFEIRIDGLIERIKQTTALTDIEDLYFRFYWLYPGEYKIDVEGLPEGFQALRNSLKDQVKPYLDIIFAEDFIRQFERIPFQKDTAVKNKYNKKTSEIDETSVSVFLSNKNMLESIESSSPKSVVKTTFEYKLRSWSNGKNVLNKLTTTETSSGVSNIKVIDVEREVEAGVGVPSVITSKESVVGSNGKEVVSNQMKLNFSKYQINTGRAEKAIRGTK